MARNVYGKFIDNAAGYVFKQADRAIFAGSCRDICSALPYERDAGRGEGIFRHEVECEIE
jgi:hypothetical protein